MEKVASHPDKERQHTHEARERKVREALEYLYQEYARMAKEERCRRREEQERRIQEERERELREERKRKREEKECKLQERERKLQEGERKLREREHKLWEEKERWRRQFEESAEMMRGLREAVERSRKEHLARKEQERQDRLKARRAAQEEEARQHFVLYEGKWNALQTSKALSPINVREMPWPVFGVVSSVDQITYQDVRKFLFHPQRPNVEGKAARDKVKSEMLRFHPDKFNARIIPKIHPSQRALAQEIAGAVARILTRIMTEEEEQQK